MEKTDKAMNPQPDAVIQLDAYVKPVAESRMRRPGRCSICGALGVNARSHRNPASPSFGKHDHSNDDQLVKGDTSSSTPKKAATSAAPSTPSPSPVAAARSSGGTAAGGVMLLEKLTSAGSNQKPRCQATLAGGENAGTQCTSPAKPGSDFCGRHDSNSNKLGKASP